MMKREAIFVWLFALLVVILFSGISLSETSKKQIKYEISAEIKKQIDETGKARVVIEFNNIRNEKIMRSSGKNAEEDLIGKIGENKIKRRFAYGSAVIAELSGDDIEKLGNDENIANIRTEKKFYANLQDSVPLINATKTWTLIESSFNLTGENQTICIIDTGVDYTHPDLGGCFGQNCKVIGGYDFVNKDNDPMDDNGHGTHVAGIAAANKSILGIAINAKIAALKVLNSGGSGLESDIAAAIDWCVGNSSLYNIRTISMSLGDSTNYSSACDSEWSATLTPSIDAAFAKNISVVVASGNSGNYTGISAPACIQNATPVGATDKSDAIASYSNRNSLLKLFAPGTSINSTLINGKYGLMSGTSMSAPHVAGAIAIINQYLQLTGKKRTPKQIENTLNASGKIIRDSLSGLNFSRINLYNSIISLDTNNPNISLVSPLNAAASINNNQSFQCNASDLSLKNVTFYLWNSTSVYNQTTYSISGSNNILNINISNISINSYKWNCLYTDENNNPAFASSNFSMDIISIDVKLIYPITPTNIANPTFQCSATSTQELSNATFYLWNSSSLLNISTKNVSGIYNSTNFSYNFSSEGNYKWNCLFVNNLSNQSFASENATVIYDLTSPNVSVVSPADGYSTTNGIILFEYNVTDNLNISSCYLIINGAASASNLSRISNSTNNITYTLSAGSYTWGIDCTDIAGNIGNSSSRILTLNSASFAVSSGDGGGGGSASEGVVYLPSSNEIISGYTRELNKKDKVLFSISGDKENHSLIIDYLGADFANITIKSSPVKISLKVGQSLKLNLTSSEYYDLYVKLEGILQNKAKITVQSIHELISGGKIEQNASAGMQTNQTAPEIKTENIERTKNKIWIIAGIFVILVLAGIIVLKSSRNKN